MRGKVSSWSMMDTCKRITPAYAGKSQRSRSKRPRHWDHPRVCGEKIHVASSGNLPKGSPPRMRGKDADARRGSRQNGITPAYAGKSRDRFGNEVTRMGSPPRMRGKGGRPALGVHQAGITPAYAGKRSLSFETGGINKDHPRVCGEKKKLTLLSASTVGSPPRMRGKAAGAGHPCMAAGITPAYAGKSLIMALAWRIGGDHPRVCGEKL